MKKTGYYTFFYRIFLMILFIFGAGLSVLAQSQNENPVSEEPASVSEAPAVDVEEGRENPASEEITLDKSSQKEKSADDKSHKDRAKKNAGHSQDGYSGPKYNSWKKNQGQVTAHGNNGSEPGISIKGTGVKNADVRTKSPGKYGRKDNSGHFGSPGMEWLKKNDPVQGKLMQENFTLDRKARFLARAWRQAEGKPQQAQLARDLEEVVTAQFQARQNLRRHELDVMQKRLELARKSMEERQKNADLIIKRRVEDLQKENVDLDF